MAGVRGTGGRERRAPVPGRVARGVLASAVLLGILLVVPPPAGAADRARVAAEAEWIRTAQLDDGAIAHHVDRVRVLPYLANFAATGLAVATEMTGEARFAEASWRWLAWYQAHQDGRGFVTDYRVQNGTVSSTGDMDSTDGYAGTFLLALEETWRVTGDRQRLAGLHPGLRGAVGAILATQDADGLTHAKPSWRVKYLMGQAEVFAGLRAAERMAAALGDRELAGRAAAAAGRVQAGVERLWNPARGAYDWAEHADGSRTPTNWDVLYPDATQQAWAVAFGLVPADRARTMMEAVARHQPGWDSPTSPARIESRTEPAGYWAPVGWAFAAVGEPGRAAAGEERMYAAAAATGRQWPFKPSDAGQLIVLAGILARPPAPQHVVAPAPPPTAAPSPPPSPDRVAPAGRAAPAPGRRRARPAGTVPPSTAAPAPVTTTTATPAPEPSTTAPSPPPISAPLAAAPVARRSGDGGGAVPARAPVAAVVVVALAAGAGLVRTRAARRR